MNNFSERDHYPFLSKESVSPECVASTRFFDINKLKNRFFCELIVFLVLTEIFFLIICANGTIVMPMDNFIYDFGLLFKSKEKEISSLKQDVKAIPKERVGAISSATSEKPRYPTGKVKTTEDGGVAKYSFVYSNGQIKDVDKKTFDETLVRKSSNSSNENSGEPAKSGNYFEMLEKLTKDNEF